VVTSDAPLPYSSDDIAVWPDGSWAFLGDIWRGDYNHMSDDYEQVRIEDQARLQTLGILDELCV
jgi:hypothetical protein